MNNPCFLQDSDAEAEAEAERAAVVVKQVPEHIFGVNFMCACVFVFLSLCYSSPYCKTLLVLLVVCLMFLNHK